MRQLGALANLRSVTEIESDHGGPRPGRSHPIDRIRRRAAAGEYRREGAELR